MKRMVLCVVYILGICGCSGSAAGQTETFASLHIYIDISGSLEPVLFEAACDALANNLQTNAPKFGIGKIVVTCFDDEYNVFSPNNEVFMVPVCDPAYIRRKVHSSGGGIGKTGEIAYKAALEDCERQMTASIADAADYVRGIEFGRSNCTAISDLLLRLSYRGSQDLVIVISDFRNDCSPYNRLPFGDLTIDRGARHCLLFYVPSQSDGYDELGTSGTFLARKSEIEEFFPQARVLPVYALDHDWLELFDISVSSAPKSVFGRVATF